MFWKEKLEREKQEKEIKQKSDRMALDAIRRIAAIKSEEQQAANAQQSAGVSSAGSRRTAPTGTAPDVNRQGNGLNNGYGVSEQGIESQRLQELNNSPGSRFYNEVYNRAMQNPNPQDRYWADKVYNGIMRNRLRDYQGAASFNPTSPYADRPATSRLYNAIEILGQTTDIDDYTLERLFSIANEMENETYAGNEIFNNRLKRFGY